MIIGFLRELFHMTPYERFRDELSLAGLDEEELRKMDPNDRVAVLEQAQIDPYDDIYLACWIEHSYLQFPFQKLK